MLNFLEDIRNLDPYSLSSSEKSSFYKKAIAELTMTHYNNCVEYKAILDKMEFNPNDTHEPEEFPMIPVRLFKKLELMSVPKGEIVKTMTSSGTSGQDVSKIFLDKFNTKNQTIALTHIMGSFIGKNRLPLLILDSEIVKKDRAMFSARGAGIIGFTTFGIDTTYALDNNMQLDYEKVVMFFNKHKGKKILMFGYTYMIWQYIVSYLKDKNIQFDLEDAFLFHIGGWKKLKDQAVDTLTYNKSIQEVLGNVSVYNYYGMAEQLGSVFVECEYGHMHCSNYSDVIIRRSNDFSVANINEKGLIQLISLLPTSYPGHILLTEDEGTVLGEDNCACGRKGKYFKIWGRIKGAEPRGCSDTYENH